MVKDAKLWTARSVMNRKDDLVPTVCI